MLPLVNLVANLRNAFSPKPFISTWKAHCCENLAPLTLSFSARYGLCGHRYVVWLKAFCKIMAIHKWISRDNPESKHTEDRMYSILDGAIVPIFNDEIIDEYREVLHSPKFQFPEEATEQVLNAIRTLGVHSDRITSEDICNDPKDVVFYEVTLSVDEAYLITGNIKHFPIKPFVVTPAQMIEILISGEIRK